MQAGVMRTVVLLVALTACSSAQGAIRILAIVNAASFTPGLPAGGGMAAILCTGITGVSGFVSADTIPLPVKLAGVIVKRHGVPAPLFSISATDAFQQITIQVPSEFRDIFMPAIEVTQNDDRAVVETVSGTWPAFFADGQGYGLVFHNSDNSRVTTEHPALVGEILTAYATGLGDIEGIVPDGYPTPADRPYQTSGVFEISVGGIPTNPSWRGIWLKGLLAPGLIAVYQISFEVPAIFARGDLSLSFSLTSCGPFNICGSIYFAPLVSSYGPAVKLPVR